MENAQKTRSVASAIGSDDTHTKRIIEALLFVAGQPMSLKRIVEILPELKPSEARDLVQALRVDYEQGARALRIQEVAGGYQLVTDPRLAPWLRRAFVRPKGDSVSKAALETLAVIAYRQPITKAEIEAIRGVDVSASLETLLERGFARVAGRKETPGRPFLYGTTLEFLRHFGLKSLEALPKLTTPLVEEESNAAAASEQAEASVKNPQLSQSEEKRIASLTKQES